jgi:hypothetical protein
VSAFSEAVRGQLVRALSLPERTIRSLATIAVGASTLLTETVFPEALRGTTSYKVTIGLMQRFILEKVAGMELELVDDQVELSDDFAQRKLVGTALEAAGLLAVGFSPLWVFAIVGDVAGGSKEYLNRLVKRLRENGLLEEGAEVEGVTDLFEAIQDAANRSALAVDMPPLSRDSLLTSVLDMRDGYARAFARTSDLMPRLNVLWERMTALADDENVPIERLGGIMAVEAISRGERRAQTARAARQAGADLFDEMILENYRQTLSDLSQNGLDSYVSAHMRPFFQMAKAHFDSSKETWTEKMIRSLRTGSNTEE